MSNEENRREPRRREGLGIAAQIEKLWSSSSFHATSLMPIPALVGDMAYRFVRARPKRERLPELRKRLDAGEIEEMQPFGGSTTIALEQARWDAESGEAVWEQEDYCRPPLRQERKAVLDDYFDEIEVVDDVNEGEGWARIEELPSMWKALEVEA